MKIMTTSLSLGLLALGMNFAANAAATYPLNGEFQLDFNSSSGSCDNELFVTSNDEKVSVKRSPQEWGDHYAIGSICHDRSNSDFPPTPVDRCMSYVEINSYKDGHRAFESIWAGPVVIDGVGERRKISRFTLTATQQSHLVSELTGFDREGLTERPISRCVYLRSTGE